MFDVGLPEFFVLGVVALLVFGPERLPEVAVQAARLIRRVRGMAESARSELTADLEPHMRELRELRELDPRKMAKRYVLDPVDEDGALDELTGKGLRRSLRGGSSPKKQTGDRAVTTAAAGDAGGSATTVAATAETGATAAGGAANGSTDAAPVEVAGNGSGANGALSAAVATGAALPPAMAPAVTPAGQRPPYDPDAT